VKREKHKQARPSEKYLGVLKKRYAKATKKERSLMLDEFVKTAGYHRTHAAEILSERYVRQARPIRRVRAAIYTAADHEAVWQMGEWFDQIGSKRLRAAMDVELPRLRSSGHLQVSEETYQHLLEISPSTLDRIRKLQRVSGRRLRGGTKPGTLLKKQVPIRTFADWDDKRVGFVEIDLVQHDGGNPRGIFACTLNLTDVCTGWTEMVAVRNKAQTRVFKALKQQRVRLPFPLLGVDSDNGNEFINNQLIRYCAQERLTFTRSRVGRKNDNAFVEQKNWSVVRRLVGYDRFDTQKQTDALNQLYGLYREYVNFFLPVTKLVSKQRCGNKVKKFYDDPKTPYQRVLDSADVDVDVDEAVKLKLHQRYAELDLVALKREIDRLNRMLIGSTISTRF
jgi:hypothetical protein